MIVEFSSQGYSTPYVGRQSAGAASFQSELTSAFGTKRTSISRCRMSAFGGRADIAVSERHVWF
jgi:hypothetical protein